ncbi:MAG: xanthine dehydrogenase family protein molybdopterin-binding subunit [Dehalococcoidia bacterium]|nr:xanthine dehydrogenase family protein molybdopterin-binding subunit [Dehalococcoidia bacterium]
MVQATGRRYIGAAIKRKEDPRFLTGRGTYVDDLAPPGTVYAAMVRSPYPHARIRSIDTQRAMTMPGVLAVFTARDLEGVNPNPVGWLVPDLKAVPHPIMARDRVRYAGEVVAVVIAEDRYGAEDAAQAVEVDYEPLPSVGDATKAVQPGAPSVHDEVPDNVAFRLPFGDQAAVDAAFAAAQHVVRLELVNQRLVPNAIEPRAALASYDPATDHLTLWLTSQNPHLIRLLLSAFVLGIGEHKVRVIAPDVGGGFGSKIPLYNEECIVAWAARRLGRPVKWTAKRSESFLSDRHGRDHHTIAEVALDADGRITALRVRTVANLGAYLSTLGPAIPTWAYIPLLSGQYVIPQIYAEVVGAYTNTPPTDAYRGAGRPEACYLIERLMDVAARELGLDPAEFRRRNFVPPDRFPYQTSVAVVYDSGNYPGALDKALALADYQGMRRQQEEARRQGRYVGIGISCYIEACGFAPSKLVGQLGAQAGLWESALVRVHPTGRVTVLTGAHSHGQGHETTFAQIVAEELGISLDDVEIVHGDSAAIPMGMGTYGSRSLAVGGSAIVRALDRVKDKARRIAAHLLEAAPEDVELREGRFYVRGVPDRAVDWAAVALQAYLAHNLPEGMEPGLEASAFYDPENFTFPFGTHISMVEVDPETGQVKVLRYVAVDDAGNIINPLVFEGQVHGGIAQGIGQALLEWGRFDDDGTPLAVSFMEYALPRASHLPSFETDVQVTPCPHNPLGAKGIGEAGTIAATPCIVNAVVDALSPLGIRHLDIPLTPPRVWRAIQEARAR